MKLVNTGSFKISSIDWKVLQHYLTVPVRTWSLGALRGMINKAVKTILKDYFEAYKARQASAVSADYAVIIPAIIAMPEFKPYKRQTPEFPKIERIETSTMEIWQGGFEIEDYEYSALKAFYEDPEEMLRWFMCNKIHRRRKKLVEEHTKKMLRNPKVKEIPAKQDDFIKLVFSQNKGL